MREASGLARSVGSSFLPEVERVEGGRQIHVAVGDSEFLAEGLEPLQSRLAQLALESPVAATVKDAASDEAVLVNPAAIALLIGASAGGHGQETWDIEPGCRIDQFRWRDKEPMAVGREVAAVPARVAPADPGRLLAELLADPFVQRRYFLDESAVSREFSHHRLFFRILSISSKV